MTVIRCTKTEKSLRTERPSGFRTPLLGLVALLALGVAACDESGDGDITADPAVLAKGERLYASCAACHNIDKRQHKIGPHLVGLFGREAGSLRDFNYSDAMRNAGIVWTDDSLRSFLSDVQGFIPNSNMVITDLESDDEIKALLAYMKSKSR